MRRRIKKRQAIENINMTPFVDILFVLLIVFMIPNQIMFGGVEITLPRGDAETVVVKQDPVRLFVKNNGELYLGEEEVKFNNLIKRIKELSFSDKTTKIYLLADEKNSYGRVIQIVGMLNKNGFTEVILVTDMSTNK